MQTKGIKTEVEAFFSCDFGFSTYILIKGTKDLKRLVLDEESTAGNVSFRDKVKGKIVDSIKNTFLNKDVIYKEVENLADNDRNLYVIEQTEDYKPFDFLENEELENLPTFSVSDKGEVDALIFKMSFTRNNKCKTLWGYQRVLPQSIPNKKGNFIQFIIKSTNDIDVFTELPEQIFTITEKIDLIIYQNKIITNNIKLMEQHLGLEKFIRNAAKKAVDDIKGINIVQNIEKLDKFIDSNNKKYSRKMMQINKFPVIDMTAKQLLNKIESVQRWKDKFMLKDNKILLRNFNDIESLIDLFTERYTKSEVTGQEYDTDVKTKVDSLKNPTV